jgi:hypothetical protein
MADKKISQLTASTTPLGGTEELAVVQSGETKKVSVANLTAGRTVGMTKLALGANPNELAIFNGTGPASYIQITNSGTGTTSNDGLFLGSFNESAELKNKENAQLSLGTNNITRMVISAAGDVTVSSGNLVIGTAGKGIDFSASTNAAGMTSELLNDYEEGTFTPVAIGSTTAGTGTYSNQFGAYTKIGNRLFFSINIQWTAHTGTGFLLIGGLPFTITNNNANFTSVSNFLTSSLALSANNVLQTRTVIGTSQILPAQYPVGGASVSTIPIPATANLYFAGNYYV